MTFRCIGKIRDRQGILSQCENVSETPMRPDKPEWGFMCFSCQHGRVSKNGKTTSQEWRESMPEVTHGANESAYNL